jgi:hypothetical protein
MESDGSIRIVVHMECAKSGSNESSCEIEYSHLSLCEDTSRDISLQVKMGDGASVPGPVLPKPISDNLLRVIANEKNKDHPLSTWKDSMHFARYLLGAVYEKEEVFSGKEVDMSLLSEIHPSHSLSQQIDTNHQRVRLSVENPFVIFTGRGILATVYIGTVQHSNGPGPELFIYLDPSGKICISTLTHIRRWHPFRKMTNLTRQPKGNRHLNG